MSTTIQERLFSMQDLKYRDFNAGLLPTVAKETIIGVRTPMVRKFAAEIFGTPTADDFLCKLPHDYFEENSLHCHLIAREKDFGAAVHAVEKFLPYVDNWATCDGLHPKVFARHRQELLPYIECWIKSEKPYTVRFGIGMLMEHFLDEEFSVRYLEQVASVCSEEYYVNMMIAWYFATALAKQYDATLPYLAERKLTRWVHNKTIQKAIESYRITPEQKEFLRTLRIK